MSENEQKKLIEKQAVEITKLKAAAQATRQMLAHDIRKPFSMLKAAVHMISNAKTLEEVKSISALLAPQIEIALGSVNQKIRDMVGDEAPPKSRAEMSIPISQQSEKLRKEMTNQEALVVVIEDSDFTHMAWQHQNKDGRFKMFYSPEEFFDAVKMNPSILKTVQYFLVDYDFGSRSHSTGVECAEKLRPMTKEKIFLYSEIELSSLPNTFDRQIEKKIYTIDELKKF